VNETEILAAIHSRWAATSQLTDMIPANRFFTGDVPAGTELPYANIIQISAEPEYTTEPDYVSRVYLQLTVRAEQFARASAIARVAEYMLNARPLGSALHVLAGGRRPIQEPHGLWAVSQDFEVMTQSEHN
jgi:hypothetical protein